MISFKKHLISGAMLAGALAIPALGLADDMAAMATPVATPTPLAWYQKVTVGGYLDAYYQVNMNNPTAVGGSPADRVFDNTENQFSLGGGELTLKQNDASSGTGYYVDLLFGNEAAVYNANSITLFSNEIGGPSNRYSASFSDSNDLLQLGQAYVTQSWGNATVTLGKFGTPVGYEVTYAPSNANFSRGLLFSQEPFFNTGVELSYALPAGFTLMGFTDDGNSSDNATSLGRDYGAQLAYSGIKNLNLTGTWYLQQGGININQPTWNGGVNSVLDDIQWGDLVATYQATSSLSFAGEYLYKQYCLLGDGQYMGEVGDGGFPNIDPTQQGYALYATYSPFNNFSISPRFEQWYNPQFGSPQYYNVFEESLYVTPQYPIPFYSPTLTTEYTLTLKYQMGPLAHMLEYRADASGQDFYTTNGNKPSFYNNVQQTLTYAAEYSF